MSTDALSLPAIEDGDSQDVRWGLETANALWAQGDHRAALRWLSRAAETAAHEDNDRRSLALARAAADLRARLNLASSLVPSSTITAPVSAPQAKAPEAPPAERTLTGLLKPGEEAASSAAATGDERPPDSERRYRPGGSSHLAVRVAVGGGLSNDGSLRVRRLAAGEVTREGEHLAMLVSLEADVDLSLL